MNAPPPPRGAVCRRDGGIFFSFNAWCLGGMEEFFVCFCEGVVLRRDEPEGLKRGESKGLKRGESKGLKRGESKELKRSELKGLNRGESKGLKRGK